MKNRGEKDSLAPSSDDQFHMNLIFAYTPVGIICLSPERKILQFNPQAEQITGYKAEDAQGLFCGDVLHGAHCQSDCPLQKILNKEKQVVHTETKIKTRTNQIVPVAMTISAMFDHDGRLMGAVEVIEDISKLKNLEKERISLISMVAHDMKSSLVSLGGFASRLMTKDPENLSSQQTRYLEIIKKDTNKLEAMVNEIVEFSRLQTGQLPLDISPTSLDKILLEIFQKYHPRVVEKGLKLKLDLMSENSSIIQADEARLKRVFTNLLENALKFSKSKGTITLRAEERDDEWVITVQDEGIGIRQEDLPYIFVAFFRGKDLERVDGSGLGLAIVKAIIEGHGGKILVESMPQKGSTFIVHLPKYKENGGNPAPEVDLTGKRMNE